MTLNSFTHSKGHNSITIRTQNLGAALSVYNDRVLKGYENIDFPNIFELYKNH